MCSGCTFEFHLLISYRTASSCRLRAALKRFRRAKKIWISCCNVVTRHRPPDQPYRDQAMAQFAVLGDWIRLKANGRVRQNATNVALLKIAASLGHAQESPTKNSVSASRRQDYLRPWFSESTLDDVVTAYEHTLPLAHTKHTGSCSTTHQELFTWHETVESNLCIRRCVFRDLVNAFFCSSSEKMRLCFIYAFRCGIGVGSVNLLRLGTTEGGVLGCGLVSGDGRWVGVFEILEDWKYENNGYY